MNLDEARINSCPALAHIGVCIVVRNSIHAGKHACAYLDLAVCIKDRLNATRQRIGKLNAIKRAIAVVERLQARRKVLVVLQRRAMLTPNDALG